MPSASSWSIGSEPRRLAAVRGLPLVASFAVTLLALFVVGLPAPAAAGTVLVLQDGSPQGNRTVVSFQGSRLRVELGPEGHRRVLIFRVPAPAGAAGKEAGAASAPRLSTTLMTDEETKSYIEVSSPSSPPAPPSSRADPAAPVYRQTARGVRIGSFDADQYEVLAGGRKAMDLWLADPAKLHVDPADTVALREIRQRYAHAGRPSILGYLAAADAPAGVPVKAVLYEEGQTSSLELVSVEQRDLPAAAFEVPAGYQQLSAPPPAPPP